MSLPFRSMSTIVWKVRQQILSQRQTQTDKARRRLYLPAMRDQHLPDPSLACALEAFQHCCSVAQLGVRRCGSFPTKQCTLSGCRLNVLSAPVRLVFALQLYRRPAPMPPKATSSAYMQTLCSRSCSSGVAGRQAITARPCRSYQLRVRFQALS